MCVFSADLGENEDFTSGSALVSKFAAWLTDWRSTKFRDVFVYFLKGPESWDCRGSILLPECSFIAWHEIRICFLFTCTCWFYFLMLLQKKKKVSDITIILTSNNSYDYLLKLLQISLCVCVSLAVGRLEDRTFDTILSQESVLGLYIYLEQWCQIYRLGHTV